MNFLMFVLAVGVTLAIFATTRPGRELAKRIGFRDHVAGAASSEDVGYLLEACRGDRAELSVAKAWAAANSLVGQHFRQTVAIE